MVNGVFTGPKLRVIVTPAANSAEFNWEVTMLSPDATGIRQLGIQSIGNNYQ